jgi:phage-related holin
MFFAKFGGLLNMIALEFLTETIEIYVVTCLKSKLHWIGLRENLQETMVFTIKYGGFL